jgi:hypothetical protein
MGKDWDRFSADPVSRSWDTKGRSMTGAPRRDRGAPGGATAKTHISDNPRCRKCGRVINGRDTDKGFKVCHCEAPDIYAPNTSARNFQQWCELWATECWRVLRPGGHLLAFGGTRTFHRLTTGIEDAGFEIRDSIAWLYACHDNQTEILTRRGWINGLDLTPTDDVAQWATDGIVTLTRPTALHRYPYDGRMIRFRNADVDQLVTPNHRVYRQTAERTQVAGTRTRTWSDWRVDQAGHINRWQPMRLPAAGEHNGPGIGGTDYAALLGWVWAEGGFDLTGTGVRVYQSSVNRPFVDELAALFDRLGPHKRYDYQRQWKGRAYTSSTWFISGDLARQVRADLPGKSPTWDLLWRMTAAEKRALWDAAMKGDGSKGQRVFWQQNRDDLEWAQALLAGISSRGKVADDPRGVLYWSDRPTVELQARHLVDAAADYTGEVWCVTVPSGAFIIRRNGRVSVSGNSGFPKSLDVGKAIDKAAGATREAVGPLQSVQNHNLPGTGARFRNPDELGGERITVPTATAPATDAARQWHGWGTALRPAHEPIVVARKPLQGTVSSNVQAWGTGAINIDACRVATTDDLNGGGYSGERREAEGATSYAIRRGGLGDFKQPAGRWPANVALDGPTADSLDAETGTLTSGANPTRRGSDKFRDAYGEFKGQEECTPARGADSGGPSRFYPVFRDPDDSWPAWKYTPKAPTRERPTTVDDQGNTSSHPTVKPVDLFAWLIRLVVPPDGTFIDPFAGSGASGEAATLERVNAILIEKDPTSLPLITARLHTHRPRRQAPPPAPGQAHQPDLFDHLNGGPA